MAPFGRQAGLSLVISFNESDWTSGWNHLLKGATLFLTPEYEHTLGKCKNQLCLYNTTRFVFVEPWFLSAIVAICY